MRRALVVLAFLPLPVGAGCLLTAPPRSDFEGEPPPAVVATDAGAATTLWEGEGSIVGAVASVQVYFAVQRAAGGQVLSLNVQRPATVLTIASGLAELSGLDGDNAQVVWTESGTKGVVWRVSRGADAGPPKSIAQTSPRAPTTGAGRAHWISGRTIAYGNVDFSSALPVVTDQDAPSLLAFVPGKVLWLNGGTSELWSRELAAGATPKRVLTGLTETTSVTDYEDKVIWAQRGAVFQAGLDGAGVTLLGDGAAGAVRADDSGVYWLTGTGLRRRKHGASTVEQLVDGLRGCATVLALDASAVVFACTEGDRTKLLRLAK